MTKAENQHLHFVDAQNNWSYQTVQLLTCSDQMSQSALCKLWLPKQDGRSENKPVMLSEYKQILLLLAFSYW